MKSGILGTKTKRFRFVENIWGGRGLLPVESVGEHFESGFGQHLIGPACIECGTHPALECAKESFHCPAFFITGFLKVFPCHLGPPISGSDGTRSSQIGPDHTFHTPIAHQLMGGFGIITPVRVQLERCCYRSGFGNQNRNLAQIAAGSPVQRDAHRQQAPTEHHHR